MTRGNQKALSSNDSQSASVIERIEQLVEKLDMRLGKNGDMLRLRNKRRFHPMMMEEMLHFSQRRGVDSGYGLLILLSAYREDLPWLYDAGKDMLATIKSDKSIEAKQQALSEFNELVDFTFHNSLFSVTGDKEDYMMLRELPMMLSEYFMRYMKENDDDSSRSRVLENEQRKLRLKPTKPSSGE